MTSFEEQERTIEKTQKHVPKWKKLLSLKYSSSAVPIVYSSEADGNEKTKKLKKNEYVDCPFKIIEKKRKKDQSNDEVSKEGKKKKKDKHKTKKQKANYGTTNDEKDYDYNENEILSKRLSLEKKVTNNSLVIGQTKLKIPEEFTHAAKAGLNYLIIWRYHKEKWKFQKTRQIWLLKNAYNEDLLSEDFFKIFLEYIEELSGLSRDTTIKIAQNVVDRFSLQEQKDDETDQKDENEKRNEQIKLGRAKAILRVLS